MQLTAVLLLVGLTGCLDHDLPWDVRVGVPKQPIAYADLGLTDGTAVAPGDVWLALRAWGGADVVYPVFADGAGLRVESPFDPVQLDPHGALVLSTRLSRGTEPAEKHPDVQYATLFVDAIVDPTLRDVAASGGAAELTLELEIAVPPTCGTPPPSLAGTVDGCLSGGTACETASLARRDGIYRAGPLGITLEVLPQHCAE